MIPTVAIFTEVILHYKTILGKFRQWCKDGSWQKSWESLLAYPTNASRVSVAAMATRKSQKEWIADYLDALWKAEMDGRIKFNPQP